MPSARTWLFLWASLLASLAQGQTITVRLAPLGTEDATGYPYRPAELTLGNSSAAAVDAVLLRPTAGPAVRQALAAPPGQESRTTVLLPALWPVQQYAVEALSAGAVVGKATAEITWPENLVTTDAFAAWRSEAARWPTAPRGKAWLLLAMFTAAAAGTLFLRRPIVRAAAILAATAAACGLVWALIRQAGAVEARPFVLVLHGDAPTAGVDSFCVLSARRTTAYVHKAASVPYPVYPDRSAAAGDDAVATPADSTLAMTLRPGVVRIVRPAPLTEQPPPALRGTVRQTDGQIELQADFLARRAMLIRNESIWLLPADQPGRMVVPASQPVPMALVLSRPERYGLDEPGSALLRYWRERHQRGGEFYLAGFPPSASGARIEVITLQAPSTAPTTTTAPSTTSSTGPSIP